MTVDDLDLSYVELNLDWEILIFLAQTDLERHGEALASFEIPVEGLENPIELYKNSPSTVKAWMQWILQNDPLELGKIMIHGQLKQKVNQVRQKAEIRFVEIFDQLVDTNPELTEERKAKDMMGYVSIMSGCQMQARRQVLDELVQGLLQPD